MKKTMYSICLTSLILALIAYMPSISFVYAYSLSDNSVMILSGNVKEDNKVEIMVNITRNSGINAMLIELVYNSNAMQLTGYDRDTALSSLDLITTNTETDKGYSITPFRFSYLGKDNDDSTGRLLKLYFTLNDDIKDGNYAVTFKYKKDKDINYIDNGVVKTKNLTIDPVNIKIKGNAPLSVNTVKGSNDGRLFFIVAGSVLGVTALTALSIFFVTLYRKRGWKKI